MGRQRGNDNKKVDIADLAARYAYGRAKNPPFVEGNKRAAFLSMGLFLGINRYRLIVKPVDTIQAVLALASGYMSEDELAFWIRNNMQKIS